MRILSTQDLRNMQVVNICGGAVLGYPEEFEINLDDCRIVSLIIPGNKGFFGIGKKEEYVIPWCCIECIGEDAILIRMQQDELKNCFCSHKRHK